MQVESGAYQGFVHEGFALHPSCGARRRRAESCEGIDGRTGRNIARVGPQKSAKEFTLLGLLKVVAQYVPAKKKRFGKDPFTGEEKWFAAKPASVRLKVRPLKKLKDAAL
ncbi:hypothetical protein P3T40_004578 [Paraburkholderia sp. EB58]|jgi:hypothetical protein